ncbi:DUF4314 domain-containing protein [Nocardia niwae]|uniref:DUF4314 domain-containing protein n=1 Tax=Nocardia niwae TaxID=626084 RepID=UPI0033D0722F
MPTPEVGDRVRITGIMPNEPCPLPVGATGTVIRTTYQRISQIDVRWDEGRQLMLLPSDPFEIISTAAKPTDNDGVAEPGVGEVP